MTNVALAAIPVGVVSPAWRIWSAASTPSGNSPAPATTNVGGNDGWQGLEYEFTAAGGWVIYRDGRDIGGVVRTYTAAGKAGSGPVDVCERADGTAELALYKVDGDTLSLAIRTGRGARPTDLEPAPGVMTFTFSRVKPSR